MSTSLNRSAFDSPASINEPGYWRECAEEAKVKAEEMTNPVAKASTLEAAERYGSLAKLTELLLREGNYGAT
jgi:hypothetical protein